MMDSQNSVPFSADNTPLEPGDTASSGPADKPAAEKPATAGKPAVTPKSLLANDIELEQEVNDALGGMSLIDLYGEEQAEKVDPKMVFPSDAKAAEQSSGGSSGPRGILKGRVASVGSDGIFVDGLGGRSQGFLPMEEVAPGEEITVGMPMDVVIVRYDGRDGLLVLSRQAAADKLLRHNLRIGSLVEATVTGSNKGGLEMKIKGSLKGFMPASQIDVIRIEDLDSLIGQKYVCEVTEVERGDKNIVLSHRNVVERQQAEQGEKLWTELAEGQTRRGVVRSMAEYGAFIDLGGVDGLLHVSEMSWARVKHPKDILEVGQEIDVIVKSIDLEKKRIGLSLKLVAGNPWDTVEQKYLPGARCQGRIVKLMNFGAFTELEPGVEGLIPVGEMTWAGRIRHPSEVLKPGEMVEVEIMDVDPEKQRISLSMKRIQGNPWDNIENKYVKDEIYTGKVVRLTDFGAFVSLEPGVDGLIHISELSDKHVNQVGEVVKENDEVRVKVLGVDVKGQRISLSLKATAVSNVEQQAAAAELPAQTAAVQATEVQGSPEVTAKKKASKPRRGGLSW